MQIQVLIILRELQKKLGMGMIFVTHDLGVAPQIADKMAVMCAGRIVEYGSARDVLINPTHPYTRGMLASTVHPNMRDVDIEAILVSPPRICATCRRAAALRHPVICRVGVSCSCAGACDPGLGKADLLHQGWRVSAGVRRSGKDRPARYADGDRLTQPISFRYEDTQCTR